jgi:hypothetical protein
LLSTGGRLALALGSAKCVLDDVARFAEIANADGAVACNEMIARWPGRLDAAVTLHPEKMSNWLATRQCAGFPAPDRIVISDRYKDWFRHAGIGSGLGFAPDIVTEAKVPGQRNAGSSGLFVVKVALIDLGFDRVVCCGIPMTLMGHVDDPLTPWNGAPRHQGGWFEARSFLKGKARSMSGWTGELLGAPDRKWVSGQ